MIDLVAQSDSKILARYHIMQLVGDQFVPSMLAAGGKKVKSLVRIFCENEMCNANCSFIPPAFYIFSVIRQHFKKVSFNKLIMFNLFN